MIDVQRLRILRAVAEHGSFNQAAAVLRLTPSAVSQQMATLERGLEAPVFDRSTRGVTLTEAGRLLLETADTVTAELDQVRTRIRQLGSGRQTLTIAAFTTGGRELLPAALAEFVRARPEVRLTVLEREPEESLPMVRRGEADLALAYHFDGDAPAGPSARAGLRWQPLMTDPFSAVLPEDHPLAGRGTLALAELAGERWVLGCSKTESYLRAWAAGAGFALDLAASTTDYFFARTLVATGLGVTLVPSVAHTPPLRGIRAVPLEAPAPARHFGLALPARGASEHARALAAALSRAIPQGREELGDQPTGVVGTERTGRTSPSGGYSRSSPRP